MTTEKQVRSHMIEEFHMLPDKVDEILKRHPVFLKRKLESGAFKYLVASQMVMVEENYLEVNILPDTYYTKDE